MHKLEITGATPEDLFMNAVRMLSVLLKGGAQTAAEVTPKAPRSIHNGGFCNLCGAEQFDTPSGVVCVGGHGGVEARSEPAEDEKTTVLPPGATPGLDKVIHKKLTKAQQAKLDAKKAATPMPSDPLPEVMSGQPDETSEQALTPKVLTLDGDIRPRLRAIQKAHSERIDPATKKPHDMAACVSYVLKLYGPFGIAKAEQLKPEQFAEFMEASEGYLSGEA